MANRFNQYQQVDYVGLPIDAYQMMAGTKEAEAQTKVDASKNAFDAMKAIQASHVPDQLLKEELIQNMHKKIDDLAKGSLKNPQVLMELGRIVNDPDTVQKLSDIYGNTLDLQAKQEADRKYQDEYGNDINIRQSNDEITAYNKLGKEGFKAGVLKGYNPGKYNDPVAGIQEVMTKMKDDGWSIDPGDGLWYKHGLKEGITFSRAMEVAKIQMTDPKYKQQLGKIAYYNLSNLGLENGVGGAIQKYNSARVSDMEQQTAQIATEINNLTKKRLEYTKSHPGKKETPFDAALEDANKLKDKYQSNKAAYANDTEGRLYQNDILDNLAQTAASPFVHMKDAPYEANPFAMIRMRSALDLDNWYKKHKLERKELKEDQQVMEQRYEVTPTTITVTLPFKDANGKQVTTEGVPIEGASGFDRDRIKDHMMNLLNSSDIIYDKNNGEIKRTSSQRKVISDYISKGQAQFNVIPSTGQVQISTPDGVYFVDAGGAMKTDLAPIKSVFDFRNNDDVTDRTREVGLSLDGKNITPVIMQKTYDAATDPGNAFSSPQFTSFVPQADPAKPTQPLSIKMDDLIAHADQYLPGFTGDQVRSAVVGVRPGVYVAVKHTLTDMDAHTQIGNNPDGTPNMQKSSLQGSVNRAEIMSLESYYDMLKQEGSSTQVMSSDPQVTFLYKKGDEFTVVQPLQGADADPAEWNKNLVKYSSQKGHSFSHLQDDISLKMDKLKSGTSATLTNSNSEAEKQ